MATYNDAVDAVEYLRTARSVKPGAFTPIDTETARIAQRRIEAGEPLTAGLRAGVVATAAMVAARMGPEYATTETWDLVSVDTGEAVA